MKKSLYILFAFFTVLFVSCKKTPLPEENEDGMASPVFYAKCDVNGISVKLEAGTDDYYMNASSFLDTTNVYVYKAELKQKSCNGSCGYALTVLINDGRVSAPGAPMNPAAGLQVAEYTFGNNTFPVLTHLGKFTPAIPYVNGESYSWEFSDGVTVNGYEATRELDLHKTYTAKLNYSGAGCSASHQNVFNIGNPLQTNITVEKGFEAENLLAYKFSAHPTGKAPYAYLWEFGDNSTSTSANPAYIYELPGMYRVKLRIIDDNNDTCYSYYQLSAKKNADCTANYTAAFSPVPYTKALSAITILVTDPSGKVYSSKNSVQPDDSNFEIVSVEDYKANDSGESTKKIKIKFKCSLKNGNTPLVINNGEAVIAVSFR